MEFNVVGMPRSGTFYLTKLIEYNFNVMSYIGVEQESFSKHDHRQHEVSLPTFIIYKPVYHWVESVSMRKSGFGEGLSRAIKRENSDIIKTNINDVVGPRRIDLNLLTNTYRRFYENWIINMTDNNKKYCFVINYIDLIDDDKRIKVLESIKNRFNFTKKSEYVNVSHGKVPVSYETYRKTEYYDAFNKIYYLHKEKGENLNDTQISVIEEIIDTNFIEKITIKTDSTNINNDKSN